MKIEDINYLFRHLQPLKRKDCINEQLRDIVPILDPNILSRKEIGALLSNLLNYNSVIGDCSIKIENNETSQILFRVTGTGVDLKRDGVDHLEEETCVNGDRYRRDINSHDNAGREGELIYELVNLLIEITNTPYEINSAIQISKTDLVNKWISSQSQLQVKPDKLNFHFWYEVENLINWINCKDIVEIAQEMFIDEKLPVLLYYKNSSELEISSGELFPICDLSQKPDDLSSRLSSYKNKMSLVPNNTKYFHQAPPISPSIFNDSSFLMKVFNSVFIYSVFAVFSDEVAMSNSSFLFTAEYGPDKIDRDEVDIQEVGSDISSKQLEEIADLYQEFARREDRDKFVEFWRRSMLQNCDQFRDIIQQVPDIRKSYQFIEREVIEKNFDELSDAVRDTNTFMTEITSQVSDTTTALSDEIQRLVFALLGAIIANLFLILRWGKFDQVIPFSLFVLSAILLFYFPLIDQRIEELEKMKSKGVKDYETYKNLISEFTGYAVDFDDLEERKVDYISYADERLKWSRRKIRQIHSFLLATGLFFVLFANTQYEFYSTQVLFSGVFIVAMIIITYRTHTKPDAYSYHRNNLIGILCFPINSEADDDNDDEIDNGESNENDFGVNFLPLMILLISVIIVVIHYFGII